MNIPEGWQLVPIEPTKEMLDRFDEMTALSYNPANAEFQFRGKHTYAKLLASAPTRNLETKSPTRRM